MGLLSLFVGFPLSVESAVKKPAKKQSLPYITLTSPHETVEIRKEILLTWKGVGVKNCTAGGAWKGKLATSGYRFVVPAKLKQEYIVVCQKTKGKGSISSQIVRIKAFVAPKQRVSVTSPIVQEARTPVEALLPSGQSIFAPPGIRAEAAVKQRPIRPLPQHNCTSTPEEFRKTGQITCGHLTWVLPIQHAQLFGDNVREYLQKYEEAYLFMKEVTGLEPENARITLKEDATTADDARATASGKEHLILMHPRFAERAFIPLASHPQTPLSSTIMHEMAHIFTLTSPAKDSFMWQRSITESYADLLGIVMYLMRAEHEFPEYIEPMYREEWCLMLNKPHTCDEAFSSLAQYASIQHDAALLEYRNKNETFDDVFVSPEPSGHPHDRGRKFTALIIELYREFVRQGKGKDFYQALRGALNQYSQSNGIPSELMASTKTSDVMQKKMNALVYVLSLHVKTDLSAFFSRERFPISDQTKQELSNRAQAQWGEFSASEISNALKRITGIQSQFPAGNGTGLKVSYFATGDLNDERASRNTPYVSYRWTKAPVPSLSFDSFSARWTGYIQPLYHDTYTFTAIADDGVRLWVDDKPIIDDWKISSQKERNGAIELSAGQRYPIRLEYVQNAGTDAYIYLYWSSINQPKEIVPQSQLFR